MWDPGIGSKGWYLIFFFKNVFLNQALVTHTCNPSYSEGSQFKASPREVICKTLSWKQIITKKVGKVAQGVRAPV
jgi:hypothetical protein